MSSIESLESESVNYDSEPVLETEFDGVDYRLDAGKAGTALCISAREPGTWDWSFVGEAKWDTYTLRCKALHRQICEGLGRQLKEALADA